MTGQLSANRQDGSLDPLVGLKLEAIAYYASDPKSVWQAIQVFEIEKHYQDADPQNWQFGELSTTLLNAAEKRAGQVYVCGLVALLMAHLNDDGSLASLSEASKIASEYINYSDVVSFVFPKKNFWDIRDKKITGDADTISKLFRKFRPAAHICAAKVCLGAPNNPNPLVWPVPSSLAFLSTVLKYQRLFVGAENAKTWNLWEITFNADDLDASYPPATPLPEQIEAFRRVRKKLKSGEAVERRGFEVTPPGS